MKRYVLYFFLVLMEFVVRSGLAADASQLAVVAAVNNAGSTTPPESMATNKPPWENSISFALTLTRGNSDTTLANATFNSHRNNLTNEWTFGADATYGENNSVEDNETLHGFAQYNHLFDERWYAYARADGLHDGIANVKYRFTASPGAGYYLIRTRMTRLAIETGPGVVIERLDGENNTYMAPRFAERFEQKFDGQAHFWEKVEFLPQATRWDNFLVNAEIGIEATVTRHVNLRTTLQDNYANEPAPNRRNNDVRLISGLAYRF